MNDKLRKIGKQVQGFVREVNAEFRRMSWPVRQELVLATAVVMVFIVLLAFSVLICDKVIQFLLRLIHA